LGPKSIELQESAQVKQWQEMKFSIISEKNDADNVPNPQFALQRVSSATCAPLTLP